jgi:hypothetical protein
MIELQSPNHLTGGQCSHVVHLNLIGRMEKKNAEQKTRELSIFSKESLEKSYDEVNEHRKINLSRRNKIIELETKLLNLCLEERLPRNPRNDIVTTERKTKKKRHNIFFPSSNNISHRFPFFVAQTKTTKNLDTSRASWEKPSSCNNCFTLKEKNSKSNRSFRQSLIRKPPSNLQICLRNQLIKMKQKKRVIIEDLTVKRKQKQVAMDTLMRSIEINSKTLQNLLQQKQEMGDRHSKILSKKTYLFHELQKRIKEMESQVSKKFVDVYVLQVTLKNLKSFNTTQQGHHRSLLNE